MKITAAVSREPRAPLSLETLDLEPPREGEILVRVVATGVCHTDIVMRDGGLGAPQPAVLGHEGAGIVEEVGRGVTKVAPGDHVLMTYNSCGQCPSCRNHAFTYCHDFFARNFGGARPDGSSPLSRDGVAVHGNIFGQSSFATHAICHEVNVVKVANDLPLDLLGPLACGVQTGAGAVINALRVQAGDSFAVFGAGSVGMSAIMAARVVGAATIIAVDLLDERLALARELGATHTINARSSEVVAQIKSLTGAGATYTLETTANPAVIRSAVDALAPRGTCGMVGASPLGTEMTLDAVSFMTQGRTLRGIVEGDSNPDVFIPVLIALFQQGRFPFDRLITFYDVEQINEAMHDSERGHCIKPIVRMRQ